ncbi:hypothetical protein [Bacillus paramycoides]|uniref:hypothetical protein n=1 Tax=Bacillus paramycoides TaxID=2026194 RepID=UPI002E1AEF07|nr:hypothetical protein [Bacillus paramycoides]
MEYTDALEKTLTDAVISVDRQEQTVSFYVQHGYSVSSNKRIHYYDQVRHTKRTTERYIQNSSST